METYNTRLFRRRPRFTDFDQDDIEEIEICKFLKYFTEKKDLVELVIRQNAGSEAGSQQAQAPPNASSATPSASNPGSGTSSSSRRVPTERQKSFPKAYVESTHRHEWLEKMENANQNEDGDHETVVHLDCEEDDEDDFIVVTPVTPMDQDTEQSKFQDFTYQTQSKLRRFLKVLNVFRNSQKISKSGCIYSWSLIAV